MFPQIATNNLTFFAVRDLIAGIYFYGQIYRQFRRDLPNDTILYGADISLERCKWKLFCFSNILHRYNTGITYGYTTFRLIHGLYFRFMYHRANKLYNLFNGNPIGDEANLIKKNISLWLMNSFMTGLVVSIPLSTNDSNFQAEMHWNGEMAC